MGCIFVPLQMLALASVPIGQLPNATALFSVVRNVGGSVGVAISTTLLSRRAQAHQSALAAHVNIWDPETAERLRQWTDHFADPGRRRGDGGTPGAWRCSTARPRSRRRSSPSWTTSASSP